jgi:mutator protein MutT
VNSAAAVAALVVNPEGKLLLTTRAVEPDYGKLDLPGGFIDPGETAEEAVKRELWEELGMKVNSMEYITSAPNEYIFSGISVFTLDMAFRVIPETISGLKAQDDIQDFRFYAEKEIDFSQIPAPSINYFVQQFFRK